MDISKPLSIVSIYGPLTIVQQPYEYFPKASLCLSAGAVTGGHQGPKLLHRLV